MQGCSVTARKSEGEKIKEEESKSYIKQLETDKLVNLNEEGNKHAATIPFTNME